MEISVNILPGASIIFVMYKLRKSRKVYLSSTVFTFDTQCDQKGNDGDNL
jgi:hypothetical protein